MNLEQYSSTHLKPGERLIRTVRPHPAVLLPAVGGGALLLLLNFFLLAWWFRHHGWGAAGFVVVLLLSLVVAVRRWYLWRETMLLITTDRVISLEQRGLFDHHAIEANFSAIQDIRYRVKGLWSTMFHFGTIEVQTAGPSEGLELRQVARPMELQQQLADLQHQRQQHAGPLSAQELMAIVAKLKSSLSPEELRRLMKTENDHAETSRSS